MWRTIGGTGKILHMTQFQIKGGRFVHRRDIFDVSGKTASFHLKSSVLMQSKYGVPLSK